MIRVLRKIVSQLHGVNYCLIGSTNLKHQGINISPNDLDFLTDKNNLQKVAETFRCKIYENEDSYQECEFTMDRVEVHFVTSSKLRTQQLNQKVFIAIDNISIPCASLQSELEFYQKCNRPKDQIKVLLIKNFLKNFNKKTQARKSGRLKGQIKINKDFDTLPKEFTTYFSKETETTPN